MTSVALTIAGSDSGGGAGIQADLKTFAAFGVHGASAITAITAQNTHTVTAILEMPTDLIRAQIDAVVEDLKPAAAKTGMLATAEIISCVAEAAGDHRLSLLVVDPVMVAKGGARLLRDEAVTALRQHLLPLAAILTPNVPEAEVLLGRTIRGLEERRQAARELFQLGPRGVVVKGGHAEDDAIDVYFDGKQLHEFAGSGRIVTENTHGSGCTYAAAIAAQLALGRDPLEAIATAKEFIEEAIRHSLAIGHGHGPVNPTFALTPFRQQRPSRA